MPAAEATFFAGLEQGPEGPCSLRLFLRAEGAVGPTAGGWSQRG
jgi:hypothetical protein